MCRRRNDFPGDQDERRLGDTGLTAEGGVAHLNELVCGYLTAEDLNENVETEAKELSISVRYICRREEKRSSLDWEMRAIQQERIVPTSDVLRFRN